MTDWDEIVQNIQAAMEALDTAQGSSDALRREPNHDNFAAFRTRMRALEDRLAKLKIVLEDEEAFALDELLDALSRLFLGYAADYRRTPRMRA
jgi:hypothetical protein